MKENKVLWLVTVGLILSLVACGPKAAAPEEKPSPTPKVVVPTVPPPTPTPLTPPTEEIPRPEVDPNALAGLNSYRSRFTWRWTAEDGTVEGINAEQEERRQPAARRIVFREEGGAGAGWTMIQIGDTQWMDFGQGWMQYQQKPEDLLTFGQGFFGFEDIANTVDTSTDYRYVGVETVNGIRTRHYVLTFSPAMIAALSKGEVSDVQSEAWIADQPGLPAFTARYLLRWKETREGKSGSAEYIFEVYDVNVPISIEAPAVTTGLPEDVPLYPNATEFFAMEGMVSFSVADDVATVADFYRARLAANGWSKDSDQTLEGTVMQGWSKAGRTIQVMISTKDGGSQVMITIPK
ncbi:MAG: hypothetical protein H5T64_11515 [Chloroflexi bacterium]|nr:hypothetical protein [Chloroflexota bacterium]